MDLFLDTNVLVGYSFKTDRINIPSIHAIENTFCKYSSTNVKKEYDRKYKEIIGIKITYMNQLINELSKKSTANPKKIKDVLNKHIISEPKIKALLDAGLSTRDINSLVTDLREMLRTCQFESLESKKALMQCIIFIDREGNEYNDVYEKLREINLVASNHSDSVIVLDAHHVGLNKSSDLYFVTDDFGDIIKRKDGIVNYTSIKDVIPLREFYDYCGRIGG